MGFSEIKKSGVKWRMRRKKEYHVMEEVETLGSSTKQSCNCQRVQTMRCASNHFHIVNLKYLTEVLLSHQLILGSLGQPNYPSLLSVLEKLHKNLSFSELLTVMVGDPTVLAFLLEDSYWEDSWLAP